LIQKYFLHWLFFERKKSQKWRIRRRVPKWLQQFEQPQFISIVIELQQEQYNFNAIALSQTMEFGSKYILNADEEVEEISLDELNLGMSCVVRNTYAQSDDMETCLFDILDTAGQEVIELPCQRS
jgi:hypothetical protein